MKAIHRDDGELCGFVRAHHDTWHALAVFGGLLEVVDTRAAAEQVVHDIGLAALAERWLLRTASADEEIVCIQEASLAGVTVAIGYYSLPGVPTRHITRDEIDGGRCELRRTR